jgi:hypothetical protein
MTTKVDRKFVDDLKRRISNVEGTQRFMMRVQRTQLADAEKLRQLVLKATTPMAEARLMAFAERLPRFYVPPRGKAAAKISKFMRGKAGR